MKKRIGVQLGRFAPYHLGHENITKSVLKQHGHNTLIMIGSSNVLNSSTPFSFDQRKEMIKCVFPNINILPLPDINPYREIKDDFDNTFEKWLAQIKQIETDLNGEFIFYGGSEEDLHYLSKKFKTQFIIDRDNDGISASMIRELIQQNKYDDLDKFLNPAIVQKAIAYYNYNLSKIE